MNYSRANWYGYFGVFSGYACSKATWQIFEYLGKSHQRDQQAGAIASSAYTLAGFEATKARLLKNNDRLAISRSLLEEALYWSDWCINGSQNPRSLGQLNRTRGHILRE